MSSDKYGDKNTLLSALNFKLNLFDIVPTERLLIFDEAGNAKRVKARLTRFLENEPVTNSEKAAIRSTLSVPASAEGLTPANNLSDVSNAATSRANLDVNSIAQDAESDGTKLVGPTMRLDGASYVDFTDNDAFTFSNGTDDTPFSVSAWVKASKLDAGAIVAKQSVSSNGEWPTKR